jgi:hypothetical protein
VYNTTRRAAAVRATGRFDDEQLEIAEESNVLNVNTEIPKQAL